MHPNNDLLGQTLPPAERGVITTIRAQVGTLWNDACCADDGCDNFFTVCHGHVTALYLRHSLRWLPALIDHLPQLTTLHIYRGSLTGLPASIGCLSHLEMLSVIACSLQSLPASIGELGALTYLCLSGNRLTALPPAVGHCQALIYLYLGRNRLTVFPESLGALTRLEQLIVNQNRLTRFPPILHHWPQLKVLRWEDNLWQSPWDQLQFQSIPLLQHYCRQMEAYPSNSTGDKVGIPLSL